MQNIWQLYINSLGSLTKPTNPKKFKEIKACVERVKSVQSHLAEIIRLLKTLEAKCNIKEIKLVKGDSIYDSLELFNSAVKNIQSEKNQNKLTYESLINKHIGDQWHKKITVTINYSEKKINELINNYQELFDTLPSHLSALETRFHKLDFKFKQDAKELIDFPDAKKEFQKLKDFFKKTRTNVTLDQLSSSLDVLLKSLKTKVFRADSEIKELELYVLNKLDLDRREKEAEKKARDLKIQEEENRKRNEQSKDQEKVFDKLKKEKDLRVKKALVSCVTFSIIFILGIYYLKPKVSSQNNNLINGYNASKKDINLEANKNNAESIAKENFIKFDLQEGIKKYKLKDYEGAREIFLAGAELNNQIALNYLGRLYENGYGVAKDYDKAVSFYEKSSSLGNEQAKKNLEHLVIRHLAMLEEDNSREKVAQIEKSSSKLNKLQIKREVNVPSKYKNLLGNFILADNYSQNSFILDLFEDGEVVIKNNNDLEQKGSVDWDSVEVSSPSSDQTYYSYLVSSRSGDGFKIEAKYWGRIDPIVSTSSPTKLRVFIMFDAGRKYVMRVEGIENGSRGERSYKIPL